MANAIEACGPGAELERVLAHLLNTPNSTVYDRAIDAVYLATHVGGSLTHHIVDGSHTVAGAFAAASRALPHDSLMQEVFGTAAHLLKDLFSVMGLPLGSMSRATYRSAATWLHQTFHVPKRWLADLLQVNGAELFGAAVGAAGVFLGVNSANTRTLFESAGSLGVTGLTGGNPLSLIVAALALVLAWKLRQSGQPWGHDILAFTRGLAAASATVAVGTALSPFAATGIIPAILTAGLVIVTGVAVRRVLGKPLPALNVSAFLPARQRPAPEPAGPAAPGVDATAVVARWLGDEPARTYVAQLAERPKLRAHLTTGAVHPDTSGVESMMAAHWATLIAPGRTDDPLGQTLAEEYRRYLAAARESVMRQTAGTPRTSVEVIEAELGLEARNLYESEKENPS